jgi:ribosomal protein S18 acetylase RimI-like enzyme
MITIREFRFPQDYDAAAHIWKTMDKGVHFGRSDMPQEIAKKISRDPDLFLVAEQDAELIGTIIGGYDGRRGMIYHLAVAAEFREKGIGAQLLAEVEKRLQAKGCLKCYLLVDYDNTEAIQFYGRHNWQDMTQNHRIFGKELL